MTDRTTGQSRGFAFVGIAKDTKVDEGRLQSELDNTRIRYMVLNRANYVFSSFRSPELRQPI